MWEACWGQGRERGREDSDPPAPGAGLSQRPLLPLPRGFSSKEVKAGRSGGLPPPFMALIYMKIAQNALHPPLHKKKDVHPSRLR